MRKATWGQCVGYDNRNGCARKWGLQERWLGVSAGRQMGEDEGGMGKASILVIFLKNF